MSVPCCYVWLDAKAAEAQLKSMIGSKEELKNTFLRYLFQSTFSWYARELSALIVISSCVWKSSNRFATQNIIWNRAWHPFIVDFQTQCLWPFVQTDCGTVCPLLLFIIRYGRFKMLDVGFMLNVAGNGIDGSEEEGLTDQKNLGKLWW